MERFIRDEMIQLPDLIVDYLAKFMRPQDCFNVSISNTFHRFGFFHGQKKRLTISRAYSLTEDLWNTFFNQWVKPSKLVYFDASHCYWLSKDLLFRAITMMPNLENLKIHGTKVCLSDLPAVFEKCTKITQLSLDVLELKLEDCKNGVDDDKAWATMQSGFQRLTHLSIFSLATNLEKQKQSWMVILALLGWCQHCTHLHIEVSHCLDNYPQPALTVYNRRNLIRDPVLVTLFSNLRWMVNLKSLTLFIQEPIRSGQGNNLGSDLFRVHVNLTTEVIGRQSTLQNVWIDGSCILLNQTVCEFFENTINSTMCLDAPLDDISKIGTFRNLEYLDAKAGFSRVSGKFEKVHWVRGVCIDRTGLNDFCQDHPQLKVLSIANKNQLDISLNGQWQLPNLKCLFYFTRFSLQKDVVEKLVQKCPNLEELHFKAKSKRLRGHQWIDAIGAIAFKRLKMLNRAPSENFLTFAENWQL